MNRPLLILLSAFTFAFAVGAVTPCASSDKTAKLGEACTVANEPPALSEFGMQQGDILLSVDGKPVRTADDSEKAFSAKKISRLEVLRKGKKVVLTK